MPYKFTIFLLVSLLIPGLHAQSSEYTGRITRSFQAGSSLSVEITNKYGRVQIIPWDKDSVKFIIDMHIRAKDQSKLEKLKRNVDFEFTSGRYFLVAQTKFSDSGSDVFKDIMDIAGSYFSTSNSVTINYTVMIPAHVTLKIENKFGDIYLDDYSGSLNIVLSYGDLKANRLNGNSEIKLTSGDGEINYLKEGQITASYANLHVREGVKLIAQTQSSVVTIDKVGMMQVSSRRDKFFLNEVGSLTGDSYFSNFNLFSLKNEITFKSRYGNIVLDHIQRSFTMVNLTSELTDLTLSFNKPALFGFDLTHHQAVTFVYPKAIAKLTTKVFNAEEKLFATSGSFGTGTPTSKVSIKALRKCSITLSQK